MKEKKYIMIRMIAWSIIAIFLTLVLVSNIWASPWNLSPISFARGISFGNKYKVVKEYKFDNLKNIKNINTDLDCGDVILSHNKENNIKVIIRANRDVKDKEYITANEDLDTINIQNNINTKRVNWNTLNMEVEILIPDSYKGNLNIDNNVCDIDMVSDFKFDTVDISLKTGDIDILGKLTANKIIINNEVGDFEANTLSSKDITIDSNTGDIEITNLDGKGSINTDVGDIDCGIDDLKGDVDISSVVGDVNLLVDDDLNFTFKGNEPFGDVDTNMNFKNINMSSKSFSGSYGDSSDNIINVKVKTGDIEIYTK